MFAALDGEFSTLTVRTSEGLKERGLVDEIHGATLEFGLARRDELVAVGGGVLMDLVGVAAAELRKETPYVVIPTTLVGQVDAGVGSKRAINFRWKGALKKSYVGDFHPPRVSIVDPAFLGTLEPDEIRAGLSEIKKVAEMIDADLFGLLEKHGAELIDTQFQGPMGDDIMRSAISGILQWLASDLWDQNLKRWPDYGHTISPLLEMETGMTHGPAVAICASLSAAISHRRNYIGQESFERMLGLTLRLGLPVWHPLLGDPDFIRRAIESAVQLRNGDQNWPVPLAIGHHGFIEASASEVSKAAQLAQRVHEGNYQPWNE
ncbi:3-dehydroquinate synthase [Kribbella yunnanensis]|uniref:3-dehydroquinate synthase n=2 Tax=Kribbella yunnanensis TaxID=190194 RepID=A0ABN2IVU1_9ACTN